MIGQSTVIRTSLRHCRFDSDSIGLVEAHGTGTVLGDPIELRALNEVFGPTPVPFCVVSALKSNIGHLNSAAGVAGVIKQRSPCIIKCCHQQRTFANSILL